MTKKVFTGERQNLPQLAQDVEGWLREQGFEVQSGTGDGKFLIQARKQSTWRSLLGNNQTIDVKIEGTPENYSIDLDAGQWVKNLADSGGAGIVAAIATIYTLGIAAAWSASERSKVEAGLWAQKDASCPACFRIGAAKGLGEKIIGCNKTGQRNGQGQPVAEEVFTNAFRCDSCSHTWDDGPKCRVVEICPKCVQRGTREATGKYIFSCEKTHQRSQQGQIVGQQVFTNTFKCKACSHAWNDGQHARLVEICPHCEKPGGIVFLERTDHPDLVTYTENYQCKFCNAKWDTGKKTSKHYLVLNALDGISALLGNDEKRCPRCQKQISRYAIKCPYCTSDLHF